MLTASNHYGAVNAPVSHKIVVVAKSLAVIACLVFFCLAAYAGINQGRIPTDIKTGTYVTQAGDSIWSIAERYDPTGNVESSEAWIQHKNGLSDGILRVGETLRVPVGGK